MAIIPNYHNIGDLKQQIFILLWVRIPQVLKQSAGLKSVGLVSSIGLVSSRSSRGKKISLPFLTSGGFPQSLAYNLFFKSLQSLTSIVTSNFFFLCLLHIKTLVITFRDNLDQSGFLQLKILNHIRESLLPSVNIYRLQGLGPGYLWGSLFSLPHLPDPSTTSFDSQINCHVFCKTCPTFSGRWNWHPFLIP